MSKKTSEVVQVGGNHYQSDYQHWDWAEEVGLGNMEYAATKYISRWRKKNGLEDLKKAQSYVFKLMELRQNKSRVNQAVFVPGAFDRFCRLNQVEGLERDACLLLNYWHTYPDLESVAAILRDIISDNFPEVNNSKTYTENPFNVTIDPNEGDEDEHEAPALL